MDRLAFPIEVKLAGDASDATTAGTLSGYGSVFGLMDRGGDIVAPGAFKGSLADWRKRKAMPPMLWQHDPWTPIGIWTEIVEDQKGLKITGQLALDVQAAADARALIAIGAVKGLSIGYQTLDDDIDRTTGVRTLKKVDLWEISLVTFAMLREAQVDSVKSIDARALERALRDEGFSGAQAVKAVAVAKKHLRDGGGEPEREPRDGGELLLSMRKAAAALR